MAHESYDLGVRAGGQLGVGLAELVDDLLGGVMFAFHRESPPPAAATPRPDHGLS